MAEQDIRWEQRFSNFEKAYNRLREAVEEKDLNELERNGMIQRFEFTVELCWRTLKDYLEFEGVKFKPTPKETIRQAFRSQLIDDGQMLIDALDLRNELSHDYSEEKFEAAEEKIRGSLFAAIEKVYLDFKEKLS